MRNLPRSAMTPDVSSRLGGLSPLVIGAAVVALVCLIGGIAFATSQSSQPGQTLASFCGDLAHQKYTDAYGLLSGGAQSQTNQSQWVQDQQLHDQIDGQVKACSAGQASGGWLTFIHSGSEATVQLTRTKPYSGTIVLTHQVDGWKVDQIDPKLQGTDLAPLQLAESFCAALARQDFTAAYADLSHAQQTSVSQGDFTKAYTQALSSANAKFAGCTPNLQSYSVQPPLAKVDVAMQVQVATSGGPSTAAVPFHFALVRESTAWKIDQITASGQ